MKISCKILSKSFLIDVLYLVRTWLYEDIIRRDRLCISDHPDSTIICHKIRDKNSKQQHTRHLTQSAFFFIHFWIWIKFMLENFDFFDILKNHLLEFVPKNYYIRHLYYFISIKCNNKDKLLKVYRVAHLRQKNIRQTIQDFIH